MSQAATAPSSVSAPVRRPRIFYGWWIVMGAMVAQFVAIGMQAQVAGVFLGPMTEDLGWTRAQFTLATSLGTGVSGAVGFVIGVYVDRFGARPLMVIGATVLGGALMALSRVEELWQFIVLRGLVFTLGFVLIGNLVVNVTVSKWFVERRGWAIAMASLGVSAAGMVVPVVMVKVVDGIGWREGWVAMGLAAWALVYPVALIMRRQPEDHGLLPDGNVEGSAGSAAGLAAAARDLANSYTRGEAVRTVAMWLLVLSFGLAGIGLVALLFHQIPFLTDAGFTRTEASLLAGVQGAAALVSKFAWGWAMQRIHPRWLASFSFLLSGGAVLAMLPIARTGSVELMGACFIVWGWGIGGMIPLSEFIWASYFGRLHLGAVRGAAMPVTILFAAGGPYFAGRYFDIAGAYDGAIVTFAALWGVAALLILLARPPAPKTAVPSGVAGAPAIQPAAVAAQAAAPAPTARGDPGERAAPAGPERAEGDEAPPPRLVPRRVPEYMAADRGDRAPAEYMRLRITEPDSPEPAPAAAAAFATDGGAAAADGEERPAAAPATVEQTPRAVTGPAPPRDDVPPRDPVSSEAPVAGPPPPPEPPPTHDEQAERAERSPPWWPPVPSRPTTPARVAPVGPPAPVVVRRAGTVEPVVNLGAAGRALQRRVPLVLAYYWRDGVASAAAVGITASLVVTAAGWMLRRNGGDAP